MTELDYFFDLVFNECETIDLFLVEVAQKTSRLFFDLDSPHLIPDDTPKQIEEFVNHWFEGGPWVASVAYRDFSNGMHIVFEGLIVTREKRRHLTTTLAAVFPQIDINCNSLRVPGCLKGSGERDNSGYFPLSLAHTISRRIFEEVPNVKKYKNIKSVKALFPYKSGAQRKLIVQQPVRTPLALTGNAAHVTPLQVPSNDEINYIRTLRPEWSMLYVTQSKLFDGQHTINVAGPGARNCVINDGEHKSNHIYFRISKTGDVEQRCFKCKGASCRFKGAES